MNILFVTNQLEMGGIEINLVRLTAELVQRGHSVNVAAADGILRPRLEVAGGIHHPLPRSISPVRYVDCARELAVTIQKVRPDVVHSFSALSSLLLFYAFRKTRHQTGIRPLFFSSIMGLKNSANERAWTTYMRVWATTVGADKVIVISPAIARVLARLPVSRRRLIQLPLVGVDRVGGVTDPEPVRERLELDESDPVVMTIGNLDPRKSHELFVRAAERVLDEFPAARFVIVGEGPCRKQLEKEISTRGLGERVLLAGELVDGALALVGADVYVRPGVVEGFVGITVLEAQAAGIPVVSFETEDVKLAIAHERTGLLATNGSADSLAAAITRLLRDPALAKRLVKNARSEVAENFSTPAIVTGLERLYFGEKATTS